MKLFTILTSIILSLFIQPQIIIAVAHVELKPAVNIKGLFTMKTLKQALEVRTGLLLFSTQDHSNSNKINVKNIKNISFDSINKLH